MKRSINSASTNGNTTKVQLNKDVAVRYLAKIFEAKNTFISRDGDGLFYARGRLDDKGEGEVLKIKLAIQKVTGCPVENIQHSYTAIIARNSNGRCSGFVDDADKPPTLTLEYTCFAVPQLGRGLNEELGRYLRMCNASVLQR